MVKTPFVSIVGAGPGDPELLTLKAYRRLQEAEAVVYDRLIPDAILSLIPRGTMRVFAGKSCKQHFMTQTEINETLVRLAKSGHRTVRLKGGDPFIFGRGGEEAEYLAKSGVGFEIVPGISAASGCGAYAGIPLTHRGMATSVRYITGHGAKDALNLNWDSLADPDTTNVFYMGLGNLPIIAEKLTAAGLSPDTPAAVVASGATPEQRVVKASLANISSVVAQARLNAPCLIIIGRVAAMAGKLEWFHPQEESAQPFWLHSAFSMFSAPEADLKRQAN